MSNSKLVTKLQRVLKKKWVLLITLMGIVAFATYQYPTNRITFAVRNDPEEVKEIPEDEKPICTPYKNITNMENISDEDLAHSEYLPYDPEKNPHYPVKVGGEFVPKHCKPRHKLAILSPMRGRDDLVPGFVSSLHYFLQHQNQSYVIYIIKQTPHARWNKGMMYNIGFKELMNDHPDVDCIAFHDVDTLPIYMANDYHCINGTVYQLLRSRNDYGEYYGALMGGVTMMQPSTYRAFNGFSNLYWGWGGEDDDLNYRVIRAGIPREKNNLAVGFFAHADHEIANKNEDRLSLLNGRDGLFHDDGINTTTNFQIGHKRLTKLFTEISVRITSEDRWYIPKD